jgi:hypothetical protein
MMLTAQSPLAMKNKNSPSVPAVVITYSGFEKLVPNLVTIDYKTYSSWVSGFFITSVNANGLNF